MTEALYDAGWLETGWPISVSLPLRTESYETLARHWFVNLLPEGRARDRIAQRLRIDPSDEYGMLVMLSGECAGALPQRERSAAPDRQEASRGLRAGRGRAEKYEGTGGVRFADCLEIVRKTSAVPAVEIDRLLRWFVFCYVVGNRDNHGKNLSRLYEPATDRWRLAPVLDRLPRVQAEVAEILGESQPLVGFAIAIRKSARLAKQA